MKTLCAVIIAVVVVAAAGCAGGKETVSMEPTVDVTGEWMGHWVSSVSSGTVVSAEHGTVDLTLTQSGSQASGDLRMTGPFNPSGPIQFAIVGNTVRIIQHPKLTGTFTVQGESMSGGVVGASFKANVTLRRQK